MACKVFFDASHFVLMNHIMRLIVVIIEHDLWRRQPIPNPRLTISTITQLWVSASSKVVGRIDAISIPWRDMVMVEI